MQDLKIKVIFANESDLLEALFNRKFPRHWFKENLTSWTAGEDRWVLSAALVELISDFVTTEALQAKAAGGWVLLYSAPLQAQVPPVLISRGREEY